MYNKFLKLLEKHNLTAYRVAKDTGISPVVFSEWKKGKSKPKVDKLMVLADYFNIPVSYFLEDTKEPAQKVGQ